MLPLALELLTALTQAAAQILGLKILSLKVGYIRCEEEFIEQCLDASNIEPNDGKVSCVLPYEVYLTVEDSAISLLATGRKGNWPNEALDVLAMGDNAICINRWLPADPSCTCTAIHLDGIGKVYSRL
ncbi:hypothetical protein INT44_005873 [Umbelopsis vinacea]|uniref:Uncharacterized protein n=1 Tax=Umbelopsis vinacea TaxID=44442 RepID=A0A8H7PYS2_9FUNG|nr:hypothetical protein INT44_005873 [Umbelopsis vinacea]